LSLVIEFYFAAARHPAIVFNVWKLNGNDKRFLITHGKVEIGSFQDIFSDRAAICAFRGILLANNIVIARH